MRHALCVLLLLAVPASAQTVRSAVEPTTGTPTKAEIDNALGICKAQRFKGGWRPGYENCQKLFDMESAATEDMHRSTVDDVIKRLGK